MKGSVMNMLSRILDERGSVLPLFAASIVVIMGFCAVSLDAGKLYVARQALTHAADAAALAGAHHLPENPALALQVAKQYAVLNGADEASTSVLLLDTNRLKVSCSKSLSFDFAGVILGGSGDVGASSTAEIGATGRLKGAVPFGIEDSPFQIGETYVIKLDPEAGDEPSSGNFQALALGLPGAANFRTMVQYGYPDYISVGDQISTEPGNMAGPTIQGLGPRLNADHSSTWDNYLPQSPRLLYVPIVESFDVGGRKEVRVKGFGTFFLEAICSTTSQVTGRFIRHIAQGELLEQSATGYGTYSVKLTR